MYAKGIWNEAHEISVTGNLMELLTDSYIYGTGTTTQILSLTQLHKTKKNKEETQRYIIQLKRERHDISI